MEIYEKPYFECTQCHYCCRHEPGFVFLTKEDFYRIVDFLKLDPKELKRRFCREVVRNDGCKLSLIEKNNHDCIFWEDGCTIYDARPVQCRTYPFWEDILKNEETWNKESKYCPGIGKGKLHSKESAMAKVKEKNSPLFSCDDGIE